MKRVLLGSIALLVMGLVHGQAKVEHDHPHPHEAKPADQKTAPEALLIKQAEYDFGKIAQNKPVYYFFEVTNQSALPLKLDNVQASCGCTTPEWSREPIPAGASDKIKVGYNAAAEGYFEKFITITYNGNQTKQIKIKGTVWKAPVGSAPANEGVQFLKQQIQ
ncbi:MAG TPA: DUF1573 domain-containing protein [Flavisolibacter sp.]|nr:DUF1573 domain-containing protein [Flavisolibacter sp.]